jgi:hypothetical protein
LYEKTSGNPDDMNVCRQQKMTQNAAGVRSPEKHSRLVKIENWNEAETYETPSKKLEMIDMITIFNTLHIQESRKINKKSSLINIGPLRCQIPGVNIVITICGDFLRKIDRFVEKPPSPIFSSIFIA